MDDAKVAILKLTAPQDARDGAWLAMRLALWPDASAAEHLAGMADALARGHHVRIARKATDEVAIGFVEASLRRDYVNGTSTSPVAFLEGLYVVPEHRRHGVARSLVQAVVHWAVAQECRELASDSLLANPAAHAAHRALGFEETERVVYFRMELADV